MAIAECAKPILLLICSGSSCMSLTCKKRLVESCQVHPRDTFRCCFRATSRPPSPLWHDELAGKVFRIAGWIWIVRASLVAGGVKNCRSGEDSYPLADEKSALRLRGENIYFTEHGVKTWRAEDGGGGGGDGNELCGTAVLSWQEGMTEHLHKARLSPVNYSWIMESVQLGSLCVCVRNKTGMCTQSFVCTQGFMSDTCSCLFFLLWLPNKIYMNAANSWDVFHAYLPAFLCVFFFYHENKKMQMIKTTQIYIHTYDA